MATSTLCLHRGSQTVSREELCRIDPPEGTDTWYPVAHRDVLDTATNLLMGHGFSIAKSRYAVGQNGHVFFGILDLTLPIGTDGVALSVGVRNSTNKQFPIGLAAGSRVFVCDNLAFSADLTVVRKHTKNGMDRWIEAIGGAVNRLDQFRATESHRIERLMGYNLGMIEADSFLLRAFETGILNTRQLPVALAQWRRPTYGWGHEGTAWHLYNAMTTALGDIAERNPQDHAGRTMKLMGHFAGIVGTDGASLVVPGPETETVMAGETEILVPVTNGWDFID
jgi:hypothetical protein